jgi:hypothetical protein
VIWSVQLVTLFCVSRLALHKDSSRRACKDQALHAPRQNRRLGLKAGYCRE